MDEESKKRLYELVQMTGELVSRSLQAEQIIMVETTKSNVYHFENHLHVGGEFDTRFLDEKRFVKMLKEKDDVELKYIVSMWNNGGVEVPTMHFRELLLEASPKNADAIFVVLTEDGKGGFALGVRTIGWSMPPAKETDTDVE